MLVPRFHLVLPVIPDALLRALLESGVDAVQVRDKEVDDRTLLAFSQQVVEVARPLGVTVLVNDRVDVALVAEADGVHLGSRDVPVDVVRRLAPHLLVGATCRTRDDVVAAARQGAAYAGIGPVFATATKAGLPAALGVDGVRRAAGVLPLIAIGGIDASRVAAVSDAGAYGVAVVSAVMSAPDPPAAAQEIASALLGS